MASEYCSQCRKYFKSLLQHNQKSACGQSSTKSTGGYHSTSIYTERATFHFHESTNEEPAVDTSFFPSYDMDQPCEDVIDICSDTNDIQLPDGAYEIPVGAIEYSHTHTTQQLGYIKILQFLDEHEVPQYAFDDLMQLFNSLSNTRFDFAALHPKRKSFMSNLRKKFPFTNYESIPVEMEKDDHLKTNDCLRGQTETVHVYRFDVEKQLRDLIASEIFHDENNLVINPKSPFGKFIPEDGRYDEIQSADWYSRTYDEYIKSDDDFMLAIKLYCDKTGCDPMLQRHALEPVMFTFTIFKRKVQQQCQLAWRHIGFLPDLDQRSKAESQHNSNSDARRGRKTRNYHRCLEKLLEPLINIQKEGIDITLRIGKYVKRVRAFFPIAMVIGDAKSNDLWCCRVSHYEQRRMSRACYTPFEKCSDYNHVCKLVRTEEQRRLSYKCSQSSQGKDDALLEELRKFSTVRCSPCLFQLDFGVTKYGQFLACTADPMHLFEGGWCSYVAKAFIKPLSSVVRLELDLWLQKLLQITRSSQRSRFPRITFSGGVTSMTNIASHEWVGVILAYLIAIRTEYGEYILTKRLDIDDDVVQEPEGSPVPKRQKIDQSNVDDESCSEDDDNDETPKLDDSQCKGHSKCTLENIVQLFEMMLCFHAFYKTGSYWKVGNNRQSREFDKAVRKMMEQLVTTLDRHHKSKGWNLQKVHEILHFTLQIKEFGSLLNADAGVGERGLKCWAKKPGRMALKGNVDVFTESTSKRIVDSVVLATAAARMESNPLPANIIDVKTSPKKVQPGLVGNPKYKIQCAEDSTSHFECFWLSGHNYKGLVELPDTIFEMLVEEFYVNEANNNNNCDVYRHILHGYTELILENGDCVRSHPNYRSQGEFYDWVIMKDPNDGVDLTTKDQQDVPECELRAVSLSRINQKFPGHVPGRVIALFKHPVTMKEMAMVHPCRPWTVKNETESSVIIECWSLQSAPRIFHTTKNSVSFSRQYFRGSHKVIRYVPMYHIVPIEDIVKTIFAIQEDPMFDESWTIHQGRVLVIADRETYWANEFMEFC